jgi:anti-anti-sigma factor
MTQATPEEKGDRLKISVSGRFDAAGAKVVADALENALNTGRHSVELDMGGVDYLSSAGMRVLIIYHRKFSQLKGLFYLTSVNDKVGRILEMTGLYNLLAVSPDHDGQKAPGQQTVSFEGWALTVSGTEPGISLLTHIIGSPLTDPAGPPDESLPEVLPFPPSTLAFGTGALGYEAADCTGRYGPFLAAGGFAAFQPLHGEDRDPDYVEYAEADIPLLHVLDAISLTGNYFPVVSFESTASPPGFDELVRAVMAAGSMTAAGFIIAAECEPAEDGVTVQDGTDDGGKNSPPGNAAHTRTRCLMLAGGVAGGVGMAGPLRERLFPADAGTGLLTHVHAAFFSPAPLRRRGPVKLKDTLSFLFDQDLQDVVCLENQPGREGLRLLRGLVWSAPLQEKKEGSG